jgi:hypothetical protein
MAERGLESTIQYWIQECTLKKHKEAKKQTVKKQVQAYLELALKVITAFLSVLLQPADSHTYMQKPVMAMAFVVSPKKKGFCHPRPSYHCGFLAHEDWVN